MTKVRLYALGTSTTLESNKSVYDLFVTYTRHRIGVLVHIDSNIDTLADIREALGCHGRFLLKTFLVDTLERIFSFFPSLSPTRRELIQHSNFLCSVDCLKNWYSICFYIGNFPDTFNAQHTHALNLLKSVTDIIHKEKRAPFKF